MRNLLSVVLLFFPLQVYCQSFWSEDFGSGCSTGNPAVAYFGSNGAWSVVGTGTNDSYANEWYVSATEAGMGVGNCGDGCGNNASLSNRTLHIGANTALVGDAGASYNAGGLCIIGICVNTDKRAVSPTIDCSGKSNITLAFSFIQQGAQGSDFASLCYFDGTTWYTYNGSIWVTGNNALVPTNNSGCGGQGRWTSYSVTLPSSANNNSNVKIGFRWINNDDGVGTDPSIAVDDITLTAASSTTCSMTATLSQPLLCFNDCNGIISTAVTGTAPFTYWWNSSPGTSLNSLSGLCAGTNTVFATDAAGCTTNVSNVNIAQPPQLVASVTPGSIIPCNGDCTGSLLCSASGGTGNLNYLWSTGSTSSQVTNVCAGTYTITISDANNCQLSFYSIFTEPDSLVFTADTIVTPSCPTCNDGSICPGAVAGGTPPYSYSISPTTGLVNGCFGFLAPGIYQVCVTDANGCSSCQTDTLGFVSSVNGQQILQEKPMPFPNPVAPGMPLQIPFTEEGAVVQLYSLQGKLIFEKALRYQKIITIPAETPVGSYLLRIISEKADLKFIVGVK
ncbi:MAG: T9SS type A sorting domain-containing protein [Bacteroidota bacterium]